MNNRVTVSFSIPQTLKEAIEIYAERTKRTQSAVVEMAFEEFSKCGDFQEAISQNSPKFSQNQPEHQ